MGIPAFHEDVAAFLAEALGEGWTAGSNVFAGPPMPPAPGVPARSVWVDPRPSAAPEGYFSEAPPFRRLELRWWVRHEDHDAGLSLAVAVLDAMWRPPLEGPLAGYLSLRPLQGFPTYLGPDASGLERWNGRAEVWYSGSNG